MEVSEDELFVTYCDESEKQFTVRVALSSDAKANRLVQQLGALGLQRKETAGEDWCDKCVGACCTGKSWDYVALTPADMHRIAQHLKLTVTEVVRKYKLRKYNVLDSSHAVVFTSDEDECPFLGHDQRGVGRCSVYEHRPRACRSYPAYNCTNFVKATALTRKVR